MGEPVVWEKIDTTGSGTNFPIINTSSGTTWIDIIAA